MIIFFSESFGSLNAFVSYCRAIKDMRTITVWNASCRPTSRQLSVRTEKNLQRGRIPLRNIRYAVPANGAVKNPKIHSVTTQIYLVLATILTRIHRHLNHPILLKMVIVATFRGLHVRNWRITRIVLFTPVRKRKFILYTLVWKQVIRFLRIFYPNTTISWRSRWVIGPPQLTGRWGILSKGSQIPCEIRHLLVKTPLGY